MFTMFTGLEAVDFSVEDIELTHTFLTTWGLQESGSDQGRLNFFTADGGHVSASVAAGGEELGARVVTWGVEQRPDLDALADRLQTLEYPFDRGLDGSISLVDYDNTRLKFVMTARRPLTPSVTGINSPTLHPRVNQPSKFHKRATPLHIGHIVFVVPDLASAERFYTEILGFFVSDSYVGRATFLRSAARAEHHQLFLLQDSSRTRAKFHHLAFLVTEIHEVFGGGLKVQRDGWQTRIGPGRHPISSVYFWYFECPIAGGAFEYYADSDYCTEEWVPRKLEQTPDLFTEWALTEGLPEVRQIQKA